MICVPLEALIGWSNAGPDEAPTCAPSRYTFMAVIDAVLNSTLAETRKGDCTSSPSLGVLG